MLRSLCSTKGQLGHHSKSHQWSTRATTMGMLGTLPWITGKLTSYSGINCQPAEELVEGLSAVIWL
jgi:hypothetical protein